MNSKNIRDYKCFVNNDEISLGEVISSNKKRYTDAYIKSEPMSRLSEDYKNIKSNIYCILPFSHTIEAEAMGADIKYGIEDGFGPRARKNICDTMESILQLEDIDFQEGTVKEILSAIKILKSKGEKVILEISGPFIIMDFLIDSKKVYKSLRKKDDIGFKVFDKFKRNILNYAKEAIKAGVDVISYADSSAGVTILGPRLVENSYNMFTRDFLIEIEKLAKKEKVLIHLCPKIAQIIIAMENKDFKEVDLNSEKPLSYEEAIFQIENRIKNEEMSVFMGQMCINMSKTKMYSGKIKMIELLEE